jgi:hypothetical protein
VNSTEKGVFIIESLSLDDERMERSDGRVLRDILELFEMRVEYYYFRTWRELTEVLFQRFYDSKLRYLHISCHGAENHLCFTLENVEFQEFGTEIKKYIEDRRIFFSSCGVVTKALQDAVIPESGCYSLIGPDTDIEFHEAAVMWATFYYLMLDKSNVMKAQEIRKALHQMKLFFGKTFAYL